MGYKSDIYFTLLRERKGILSETEYTKVRLIGSVDDKVVTTEIEPYDLITDYFVEMSFRGKIKNVTLVSFYHNQRTSGIRLGTLFVS